MSNETTNDRLNNDPDQKPRRVIARFSEAEFQTYLKRVEDLGTTRSRMIRHLIREFLGLGPDLFGPNLKTIDQGIYQLGALGRNLNQQIRAVNSGLMIAQPVDGTLMVEIKNQLQRLENEWIVAVKRSRNGGTQA
jgi:hypothetical protein